MAMLSFLFEKLFGFGSRPSEPKDPEGEGEEEKKKKKKKGKDKKNKKEPEKVLLKNKAQLANEHLFR